MEAAPGELGPWAGTGPRWPGPLTIMKAEQKGWKAGFSPGPALQAQSPSSHRHCTLGRWLRGLAVSPGHEGIPGQHRTPAHVPAARGPLPTTHMGSENTKAKAPRSKCPSLCPKGSPCGDPRLEHNAPQSGAGTHSHSPQRHKPCLQSPY